MWEYAVVHAANCLNSTVQGKDNLPPLEVVTGSTQRVINHLPFGCAAVVTTQVSTRASKLVPRGEEGVYVGQDPQIIGSYLI